jgi:hypothetical protein
VAPEATHCLVTESTMYNMPSLCESGLRLKAFAMQSTKAGSIYMFMVRTYGTPYGGYTLPLCWMDLCITLLQNRPCSCLHLVVSRTGVIVRWNQVPVQQLSAPWLSISNYYTQRSKAIGKQKSEGINGS